MTDFPKHRPFPSAEEDARAAKICVKNPQTESPAYRLAYLDAEFMLQDALRPVRLQLELLKPELEQQAAGIESTVVVFGSARILEPTIARERCDAARNATEQSPADEDLARQYKQARRAVENANYYEEARRFAELLSRQGEKNAACKLVVITGGGPGIMEAANRGAYDAGAKSIGLNIVLPAEQAPNPYITPELCFQFHYFAIRKMHFLLRAKALVVFPGGFGTLDELFDALTLVQTQKAKRMPILLFGKDYWQKIINFEALLEEGMISAQDLGLLRYVETAEDACQEIIDFYRQR
ncbi:MAG TPA: TIGR00730 family Rossman fold protein [Malonomonas sp.]